MENKGAESNNSLPLVLLWCSGTLDFLLGLLLTTLLAGDLGLADDLLDEVLVAAFGTDLRGVLGASRSSEAVLWRGVLGSLADRHDYGCCS